MPPRPHGRGVGVDRGPWLIQAQQIAEPIPPTLRRRRSSEAALTQSMQRPDETHPRRTAGARDTGIQLCLDDAGGRGSTGKVTMSPKQFEDKFNFKFRKKSARPSDDGASGEVGLGWGCPGVDWLGPWGVPSLVGLLFPSPSPPLLLGHAKAVQGLGGATSSPVSSRTGPVCLKPSRAARGTCWLRPLLAARRAAVWRHGHPPAPPTPNNPLAAGGMGQPSEIPEKHEDGHVSDCRQAEQAALPAKNQCDSCLRVGLSVLLFWRGGGEPHAGMGMGAGTGSLRAGAQTRVPPPRAHAMQWTAALGSSPSISR